MGLSLGTRSSLTLGILFACFILSSCQSNVETGSALSATNASLLYVSKSGDTMTGPLNLPSNGLVVGTNHIGGNSGGVMTLPAACAALGTTGTLPSSCGTPASCPSGWTQADLQVTIDGIIWTGGSFPTVGNEVRTCFRTDESCSILVLQAACVEDANANIASLPSSCGTPASCPSGWTQADLQTTIGAAAWTGGQVEVTGNQVRTCFICQ